MGIKSFIHNWRIRRIEHAEKQRKISELFDGFLTETKPLTPKAPKYHEAALYRHAWKRALILSLLFEESNNPEKHDLYVAFTKLAASKYNRVAPDGPYGTVRLKMTPETALKLLETEERRHRVSVPRTTLSQRIDNLI